MLTPLSGVTATPIPTASLAGSTVDPATAQDLVTIGNGVSIPEAPAKLNRFEQGYRYTNDFAIQLVAGDLPAVVSIAANVAPLPAFIAPALGVFNAFNAFTGYVGLAADLRAVRSCMKNPNATRTDKIVDWVHIAIGDIVNTAASMTPLFVPLSNPLAMGFFVGGQVIGTCFDVGKTIYDVQRKGQQSAVPKAPVAPETNAA